MENKDPNIFVVCDYAATGEGTSIMTLITRAQPRSDDYVTPCYINDDGSFRFDPETVNTPQERALREFKSIFGEYYALGAEILDRYEFFHRYSDMVPPMLYKMCDPNDKIIPPGFNWYGSLHYNYS